MTAGRIDIENFMLECKEKVVVGGLNGQKMITSEH